MMTGREGCLAPVVFRRSPPNSSFAAGLATAGIRLLAGTAQGRDFKAGEYLWKQGDHAEALYLISSGRIALEILVPYQGPLQIETAGPGEVIGCAWLLEPYRWHFDARALEDVSALVLEGKRLREQCDDQPLLGYGVLKRLTPFLEFRLQKTRIRILELHGH
jgi:CRP-like cAMP-binding protein